MDGVRIFLGWKADNSECDKEKINREEEEIVQINHRGPPKAPS